MTAEGNEMDSGLRAFEREASALRPSLHRYCARMVGSVIDGEDVLQEALVKAYIAIRNGAMPDQTKPWLYRIAHNCAIDLLRGRARLRAHEVEVEIDALAAQSSEIEARIATQASLATIMELPPAQRSAVVLKDVLGQSLEEIGQILETSEISVKGALQRGRETLRCLIARTDSGPQQQALDPGKVSRLRSYVAAFNAHDFDSLRALLADDVKLELVNRLRAEGKDHVGNYFGRYAAETHWHFSAGLVEDIPAVLVTSPDKPDGAPRYFILIDWDRGKVAAIRDFLFADYVTHDLVYLRL